MTMRALATIALSLHALAMQPLAAQTIGGGVSIGAGVTIGLYPVVIPSGATAYTSLEQAAGWSGDSTLSVSGAYAPAVCELSPTGNGNPCPGAGTTAGGTYSGGGGGATLDLITTGVTGYSGWMAKKSISPSCGQLHMRLDVTLLFSGTIGEVQAIEFGRRLSNCSSITDNGQLQLVPIGGGLMELDYVPSSAGGWADTGCRFPMVTTGVTYPAQIYYVNDASGALSIPYFSFNGTVCPISLASHIAGASLGWAANTAVIGIQPDAKPTSTSASYTVRITVTVHTWN